MALKFFIPIILLLLSISGYTQEKDISDDYKNCLTKISYHSKRKTHLKNVKKDSIRILFFQSFSDSVSVYVNGLLSFSNYIEYDSTLVSTDYSGIAFSYKRSKWNDKITVVYKKNGKYLSFRTHKKYPLYSIHSYLNTGCMVAARREPIVIK